MQDEHFILQRLAEKAKIDSEKFSYRLVKKSIDARKEPVVYNATFEVWLKGAPMAEPFEIKVKKLDNNKSVLIIGAGPAGLFAAIELLAYGIKPIIIERGKNVKDRRRDLAILNRQGIVNPESNYCFGEGGAGTYSDGKLYTRSGKRGNIQKVLEIFCKFGAPDDILIDAHPHIGTNKLPHIITAIREFIIEHGGEVYFNKKFTGINRKSGQVTSIFCADGDVFSADAYILATGHSARDIFHLLHKESILIEQKPFALGVRIEHPQSLINQIQYHSSNYDDVLPPASYSLVEQVDGRGVFSFCMCPGGIIAPASTSADELVVNGWSPSKRNNPFANSGMVAEVRAADAADVLKLKDGYSDPLLFMKFQQLVEQQAYTAGGGNFVAPAQRVVDFCKGKLSSSIPSNSYLPGTATADMRAVLPAFVHNALQEGIKKMGKKLKGYYTNDAIVVATESRTSSPIRIPRHDEKLHHPQLTNLYPCGEGAGYAGGIVSAAIDGQRVSAAIASALNASL